MLSSHGLFHGVLEVNTHGGKMEEQSKNPFQSASTFMDIFPQDLSPKEHLISARAGPRG